MNQFFSRLVLATIALTIVAGLAGCNSKPTVEGTPPTTDTANRNTGAK